MAKDGKSAVAAVAGARILIENVSKSFGGPAILDNVGLDIAPGEVVALLGSSGSGKTTLLRMIAGLATPTAGRIAIADTVVADAGSGRFVPPEKRSIGMVFQDYALWPHMTVAGNVSFPLEMQGVAAPERARRVAEALELVNLGAMASRSPATLSGGQQQRVALARAIAASPSVILFDEPLSNLDRELREQLVIDIAALVRSLGLTAVYVTHDHSEAFAMADRVAVMVGGRPVQVASPEDLVSAPSSADVASFLKLGLVAAGKREADRVVFKETNETLRLPDDFAGRAGEGHLFVPRNALSIAAPDAARLPGRAVHSAFRGDGYQTRIQLACGIDLDLASDRRIGDGEPVGVDFAWERARWFAADPINA
ncbi:ABC transporter ATP-binding protein [Rhizobium sp. L1K21]|uniref:ABC transporter ATP-binding protein n=1 Tax=Rhizobium sp. L1K21 TaxID=2954933 RepID=UPI002093A2EF|nr:ABC transporter ATP-binding protein [Rhizobium sp. L1K21]MCO6186858.1 ABC transporter ATP-binding protein [Rhizobium sp. L1K21]